MMIKRSATTGRAGALTLEAAVVYPLMLTLVFMIIIGGMGVFRYQQVACQAREAARWAAVRGSDWHKETGQTYPTSTNILQQAVLPLAAGMNTNNLSMQVQWLDQVSGQVVDWDSASKYPVSVTTANQGVTNRIRVTVTYQWTPELFLLGPIRLQSTSEMPMCY
jgi:Flp pilus assembly protein TadG